MSTNIECRPIKLEFIVRICFLGKAHAETENLKEMGDVSSGTASHVIQIYLKDILNCFLNADSGVRFWAMKVIEVVLRQGLVPPVQIVPYLILLSTDPEKEVSNNDDEIYENICH